MSRINWNSSKNLKILETSSLLKILSSSFTWTKKNRIKVTIETIKTVETNKFLKLCKKLDPEIRFP